MDNGNLIYKTKSSPDASMRNRFINYLMSKTADIKTSVQTACFDTITGRATFASDFFFKPEELKHW